MDTVNRATRSRIMAAVRHAGTGPEITLRKFLHRLGFRFVVNDRRLPGSPDIVLPKYKAAIFVHGCFWHRHGCKYSTMPTTSPAFWRDKFQANQARDRKKILRLRGEGWRVKVVWECALKGGDSRIRKTAESIRKWLLRSAQIGGKEHS